MISVILGYNIDTAYWIKFILKSSVGEIIVIDYEYCGMPIKESSYILMSSSDAQKYLKGFSEMKFYKSMYGFPVLKN